MDEPKKRILFVCSGNTCRSPMAEAVCKDLIKKRNLDIEARSAGIMAPVGCPMSENAARALEHAGITGFTHEAEELTPEAVDWADSIYVMTKAHQDAVLESFPDLEDKIHLLRSDMGDIVDPFGGDLSIYEEVLEQITHEVSELLSVEENYNEY